MSHLIAQWRQRHGLSLDGAAAAGYQSVTIDRVRLRLSELPSGAVLAETRLAPLPLVPAEQERLLEKALKVATARLRESVGSLAVDPDGAALWLQLTMPGQADVDRFDEAVERLVNEVEQWRKVL